MSDEFRGHSRAGRRWPGQRGRHDRAAQGPPPPRAVVTNADDLAPRLFALAKPLVPQGGDATFEDWNRAISLVSSAWNASIVPGDFEAFLTSITVDEEDLPAIRVSIQAVMDHKKMRFPDDERLILEWELDDNDGSELTLNVQAGELA
ncbi:MAG: hypothetical protein ACI9OJ_000336 [Myxococcota bacterium]|jgi:hypothetical protein